ncbi:hypothetical protein EWM64_g1441 [Hericium alpestre]|uniref:Uncharacterized protein n=1 Tax=Hericium alpestre TaxID=135208 RepID=A0A4Z0A6B4_9AGAM|nr:hypothetical protein EWM64_g1441 [Hericium alpestre]
MSYQHIYPASSVFQSEDYTYDERDATTVFQMPAASNGSVNNDCETASFSATQKAIEDFNEFIRGVQYKEYIANSPQMNQSQGATGYGASMATSHFNNNGSYDASIYGNMPTMGASMATSHHNNNGGYDASAYGNMPAMSAGFADGQLAFANNLQLNTAVPAHASTWAVEDAFPMDDFTMAASGMNTYPPAPAMQYSYAEDTNEYPPPNEPPPGYHPHTPNDILDSYVEPTYVPGPTYSGPMLTGTDANTTYHQPAPVYYPGPTPTGPAPAPVTYTQPAPPDFMTSADWLSTQPQPVQSPVHYAQPNVGNAGYAVDPRQPHWSSSTIYDTYAQSPGTPSLGYSSGSSAISMSPATPRTPAFPVAHVTGKRNAGDAGFDPHDHHYGGLAQIIAHPPPSTSQAAEGGGTTGQGRDNCQSP